MENMASITLNNVSVILVNYKTLALTRNCLELLQQGLQSVPVSVYVVDNHSEDESERYLRSLDWINLIERQPMGKETGSQAHGRALDCALDKVTTDYVILLHSDTMVHDVRVFSTLLAECIERPGVAAVGCLEQLDRGPVRTGWRLSTRFIQHYVRRGMLGLGLQARPPKPYKERHLKSFCALWNVRLMRAHGLTFQLDDRNPGYELQDRLQHMGYSIKCIPTSRIFRHVEHLQSGTVAALGGYSNRHRRVQAYEAYCARAKI